MPEDGQTSTKDPEEWVRIVSTDGYSYLIKRKVAMTSGTLRDMLSTDFAEGKTKIHGANERGVVVEKLCEYLQYKHTYQSVPAKEDIPEFNERIPPEVALELLVVADYYNA